MELSNKISAATLARTAVLLLGPDQSGAERNGQARAAH